MQASFGVITNGDDVLFVKIEHQPRLLYGLSRAFSLYTDEREFQQVLSVLTSIGSAIA